MDRISALCISHPSRYGLLQRAIINFLQQDYAEKELVIVVPDDGYADIVKSFLRDPRLGEAVPPEIVQVRSFKIRSYLDGFVMGMAWASGRWIAAWDDDNLSHPQRLSMQAQRTMIGHASVFSESLYYYYEDNDLFVVNYTQPGGRSSDRCASPSLFFHRSLLPAIDIHARDSWESHIVDRLTGTGLLDYITGSPQMFVVGTVGDNMRGEEYHRRQSTLPATWTAERCTAAQADIDTWLKSYQFPSSVVDVSGKDGQALQVTELKAWPAWLHSTKPPEDWQLRIPGKDTEKLRQQLQQEQHAARQQQRQQTV